MSTIFAIDFGTANSSASFSKNHSVGMLEIDRGANDPTVLRSVLYFDDDRVTHIGQEAIDRYIEDGATGRFLRSVKAFLPMPSFTGTVINGKRYDLQSLIALILRQIRIRGEKQVEEAVDTVVLGRPVVFSEDPTIDKMAEERLRQAAEKAGFSHVSFQFEPIAAALLFETTLTSEKEQVVLVGDFGGGTSDFTIMKLGKGRGAHNRRQDVLALGGAYIGGDTFDSLLMWDKIAHHFGRDSKFKSFGGRWEDMPISIMTQLRQWHLIPQLRERKIREMIRTIRANSDQPDQIANLEELVDSNTGMILFRAIEKSKCELSSQESTTISFTELSSRIGEEVLRDEFEYAIFDSVRKIGKCIDSTLEQAQLTPAQVDHVFLTGGSSHIPVVRNLFERRFGPDKLRGQDTFTSVAHGLGFSATQMF